MKRRILLLEDEVINQRILHVILGEDYQISVVENGSEAFSWLEEHQLPDLIIMDWVMPVMDGKSFLSKFQFCQQFVHIPVIVLSSYEYIQDELRSIAFQTKFQLSKPVNPQLLRSAIAAVIPPLVS